MRTFGTRSARSTAMSRRAPSCHDALTGAHLAERLPGRIGQLSMDYSEDGARKIEPSFGLIHGVVIPTADRRATSYVCPSVSRDVGPYVGDQ
jgi:hypothetical protein